MRQVPSRGANRRRSIANMDRGPEDVIDAPPGRLVMIVSTAGCIVEKVHGYEEAGALMTSTHRRVRRRPWRRPLQLEISE